MENLEPFVAVGMIGCGSVGKGVLELLMLNSELITRRCGRPVEIVKVAVRDSTKPRSLASGIRLTTNASELVDDKNLPIIIEVMGGLIPALPLVRTALVKRKTVITANKELIAHHGDELQEIAWQHGGLLLFEASVGGGIPVINALSQGLSANQTEVIEGIVNGTTNLMLSQMTQHGREFSEVLTEAQQAGYAEADPSSDVDGHDARFKLSILINQAFGLHLHPSLIACEGIGSISAADIAYARELGCVIKLIAFAQDHRERGLEAWVGPVMLPAEHRLARVDGAINALLYQGNGASDIMLQGPGAGPLPTASAILSDVMQAVAHLRQPRRRYSTWLVPTSEATPMSMGEVETSYALRMKVADHPGSLAAIAASFAQASVNIKSVVQKPATDGRAEIFWVTSAHPQSWMVGALKEINALESVEQIFQPIRVHASYHD